jgi:hypothetical protein
MLQNPIYYAAHPLQSRSCSADRDKADR